MKHIVHYHLKHIWFVDNCHWHYGFRYHIFAACALIVAACIDIWLNRKLFLQRFKGLGWKWWMLIVAVIVATIATAAID